MLSDKQWAAIDLFSDLAAQRPGTMTVYALPGYETESLVFYVIFPQFVENQKELVTFIQKSLSESHPDVDVDILTFRSEKWRDEWAKSAVEVVNLGGPESRKKQKPGEDLLRCL